MKEMEAPGTTFRKHLEIAKGVLSEDDYLLSEIMFSNYTFEQIDNIGQKLEHLKDIVKEKDTGKMVSFLKELRENISEKK
jgi:prephenate dehydrogenase